MAILRHAQVVSDTGSLISTASTTLNIITFTKGDGSTFPITVDTGSTFIGTSTSNNISFWNTSTTLTGSTNLYWDTTNQTLNIGTQSAYPGAKLVLGSSYAEDNNADLRIVTKYNQRIIFVNATSSRAWYIHSDALPLGPNARDGLGIGTTSNPTIGGGAMMYFDRSGSITVSASFTITGSANISNMLTLRNLSILPTGTTGSLAVSGSRLYFHNGTGWAAIT